MILKEILEEANLSADNLSAQNKGMALRWFDEVWNQENSATIDELFPEDCVLHDGSTDIRGPREFRAFHDRMRSMFSSVRIEPGQVVSEGDLVCVRWTAKMVHAATSGPISTTGMSVIQFRNGRFHECWQNWDELGLIRQVETATKAKAHTGS
jgi:hypothetical protein